MNSHDEAVVCKDSPDYAEIYQRADYCSGSHDIYGSSLTGSFS